jgi:monothiol glutaredoxin
MMTPELKARFDDLVTKNDVVLFMKGRRSMPQCGFSGRVVQVLDQFLKEYTTVNVLEDPSLRDGIKEYTNWPTIPQLYVKGKFVGGHDIVLQMFESGDLHSLFGQEAPKVEAPRMTISDGAKQALLTALAENEPGASIRFTIDPQWRPGLDLDQPQANDFVLEVNGVKVLVDRGTAKKADGVAIDFVPGETGGFKIDNPNEPPRVKMLGPSELKAKMDAGEKFELFDVRTDKEREIARIEPSRLLDQETAHYIEGLDKDQATLVFYCHQGPRSMAAAQHFLQQGFKKVFNLRGGINAWSLEVDPKVPRY